MISQYLDVTAAFNAANGYVQDLSNWDYCVFQFVNPSGTISITATNDGGAIQGETLGSAATATNFQTIQAAKLADGTAVTSVAAAGLYRVGVVGRYLKLGGASAAADKVFLMMAKIS